MKKIFCILLCVFLLSGLCLSGCTEKADSGNKLKITATLYSEYDFARAVAGDKADVTLLIPPGSDIHSYEPTINNITGIQNSDLFLYIGGESDTWVEYILASIDVSGIKTLKMCDYVCLTAEHNHEHDEHCNHSHSEEEYDEHIWTSPDNAEKMLSAITDALCEIDPDNSAYYKKNSVEYTDKIKAEAEATANVIANAANKTIAVADRFPYRYLTDYYGINYVAAFSGCAEDTDADLHTVIKLIEAVNDNNLTAVYVTELCNENLAKTVSENTNAEILILHSYQNISPEDFKSGVTYIDLMRRNKEALAKGLN